MASPNNSAGSAVKRVSVVTYNGWLERFSDMQRAAEYVAAISRDLNDPDDTLDQIQVLVELKDGNERRCAFKDKHRTIEWMRRFVDLD